MTKYEYEARVAEYIGYTSADWDTWRATHGQRKLPPKSRLALYTMRDGCPLAKLRPKVWPAVADIPLLAYWEFVKQSQGQAAAEAKLADMTAQ